MFRALLSFGLLAVAASVVVPAAAAYTLPTYCLGHKEGMCDGNAVLSVDYANQHADVCVIAVAGSCEPYDGHLVRADVNGQDYVVPDPCYTTMCF